MPESPTPQMPPLTRLKNILGGSAGNFVEWFDWFAYASFAIYFSRAFFPEGTQTTQLLQTAFIFAGGFVARPLGALLLGIYADRAGRRAALTLSVAMMCAGSLLIALIPTGLGFVSPLLLVLARLLQGLSVGGEYGASATYVSEMAGKEHRGFWSGFLYVTLIGGQLAAMLLQLLLQNLLTEAQMYDWGWRIPFVIGALMAVVVFWIRRGIHETRSFERAPERDRGKALLLFTHYPKETAIVMILTAGGGVGFYTYTTYMQKLLVNTAGFDKPAVTQLMVWVLATFLFLPPLAGWISDHFGRKRTLAASFGMSALLAVPVLSAISTATDLVSVYLLCVLPLFALSGYTALSAIIKAELYPAHIRALGVAVPYSLAMAVFGGNAEATALYFKDIGHEAGYYWLVAAIFAVGFVVAASMRDTREHTRIEED
ncbi:MAG TPA: MFS transporter [Xanthomonadales bacterium]|nr:MFS transporter [Xanthomonadales bacterium]